MLQTTQCRSSTRGEVRQSPQGAKRQGALWADGLFALLLNSKDRRTLTRPPPAEVLLIHHVVVKLLLPTPLTMEVEFTLWYLYCFFTFG